MQEFFNWFWDPVKNHYFDFEGRTSRKQFWMFILVYIIVGVGLSIVFTLMQMPYLTNLFSLALLLPSLGITARRLHDIGMSGWWQLVGFVPLIGLIVLIFLTAKKGDENPNKYGAPKVATMPTPEPAPTEPEPDSTEASPEENPQRGYDN